MTGERSEMMISRVFISKNLFDSFENDICISMREESKKIERDLS